MAAHENINPHQLAMFMPARELFDMHSLDTHGHQTVGVMRRMKRQKNRVTGLGENVREQGVHDPVQIVHGDDEMWHKQMRGHDVAVANGNHRLVAGYDANPDMEIPVLHYQGTTHLVPEALEQTRRRKDKY